MEKLKCGHYYKLNDDGSYTFIQGKCPSSSSNTIAGLIDEGGYPIIVPIGFTPDANNCTPLIYYALFVYNGITNPGLVLAQTIATDALALSNWIATTTPTLTAGDYVLAVHGVCGALQPPLLPLNGSYSNIDTGWLFLDKSKFSVAPSIVNVPLFNLTNNTNVIAPEFYIYNGVFYNLNLPADVAALLTAVQAQYPLCTIVQGAGFTFDFTVGGVCVIPPTINVTKAHTLKFANTNTDNLTTNYASTIVPKIELSATIPCADGTETLQLCYKVKADSKIGAGYGAQTCLATITGQANINAFLTAFNVADVRTWLVGKSVTTLDQKYYNGTTFSTAGTRTVIGSGTPTATQIHIDNLAGSEIEFSSTLTTSCGAVTDVKAIKLPHVRKDIQTRIYAHPVKQGFEPFTALTGALTATTNPQSGGKPTTQNEIATTGDFWNYSVSFNSLTDAMGFYINGVTMFEKLGQGATAPYWNWYKMLQDVDLTSAPARHDISQKTLVVYGTNNNTILTMVFETEMVASDKFTYLMINSSSFINQLNNQIETAFFPYILQFIPTNIAITTVGDIIHRGYSLGVQPFTNSFIPNSHFVPSN